jgi:hypothetical protein
MSNIKKYIVALMILVGLVYIAKGFNNSHDMDVAIEKCGSRENIIKVDSQKFECKKHNKPYKQDK